MQTKPTSYTPPMGEHIIKSAEKAIALAKRHHRPIEFKFNGHTFTAWPDSTPSEIAHRLFQK